MLAHETQSAEAGEMREWRCAIQQSLTVTVHIPVRNVAKENALTAAATMVRHIYVYVYTVSQKVPIFELSVTLSNLN